MLHKFPIANIFFTVRIIPEPYAISDGEFGSQWETLRDICHFDEGVREAIDGHSIR